MRQPHKGGCYGPPPQCNIQGAQLPKSRPCHLQLLRLPRSFLLLHFTGVICMGLPMQRTCNTHATHMQHTCNTHATHMQHEHFPCKFPSKVVAVAKIYTFHSKTGVGAANVKSCTLTVNLQVKSSCCMSCCMCVACVLHVCCMCVAWQVCRIEQSRSQSGAPATQNDSQCTQRHCRIRSKRCQDKTVTACISLSTTHISTYAPAQANRHTHTQTPAQTDPDAFSDTVASSFSRLSAAMGPSYCVFSESVRFFWVPSSF